MANMHALDAANGRFRVVMHFPIPVHPSLGTVNAAGLAWSTALIRSGRYNKGATILPDGDGTGGTIGTVEKAAIVLGTVVECVEEVLIETAQTNAERLAYLDAKYAQVVADAQASILKDLRWYGFNRG